MSVLSNYLRGLVQHRLMVAVVLLSAIGVVCTSKDLLFTPVAAGTLAGIMLVALRRVWQMPALARIKQARAMQFFSVAVIPVLFAVGMRVNERHAFTEAVGMEPLMGVRSLTVDTNLNSPSGSRSLLMRFVANEATLDAILAAGQFKLDRQITDAWHDREPWTNVARLAFGDLARWGGSAWMTLAPGARPECRRWLRTENGTRVETSIVWDAVSGQAWLLYRQI